MKVMVARMGVIFLEVKRMRGCMCKEEKWMKEEEEGATANKGRK